MDTQPNNSVDNRQPDGTFGPGNNANPAGRPKGKTLKEYKAQKFRDMTDEEKEAWIIENKVSPDLQWRMAEGNPATQIEGNPENPLFIQISKEIADKNDIDPQPIDNSKGQTPI